MISFERIDYSTDEFVRLYDELPLWSASFGLLLLEHVPLCAASSLEHRLDLLARESGALSLTIPMLCVRASKRPSSSTC